MELKVIGHIRTDFPAKFGVPRQSGLVPSLAGRIIIDKAFGEDSFRGIDDFSHIWVIWGFSDAADDAKKPTVRPPRLGGNKRVGVFASRSPYRPNALGLSALRLEKVETTDGQVTLTVSGIDMTDGTPVYDIKPYLPISDRIDGANGGYSDENAGWRLEVDFPSALLERLPADKRAALVGALSEDPRPAYHEDGRTYGFVFAGFEIKFTVNGNTLFVTDVIKV